MDIARDASRIQGAGPHAFSNSHFLFATFGTGLTHTVLSKKLRTHLTSTLLVWFCALPGPKLKHLVGLHSSGFRCLSPSPLASEPGRGGSVQKVANGPCAANCGQRGAHAARSSESKCEVQRSPGARRISSACRRTGLRVAHLALFGVLTGGHSQRAP